MPHLEISVSFPKEVDSGVELRWSHITQEKLEAHDSLHGGGPGRSDGGAGAGDPGDAPSTYELRREIGVWRMAPGRAAHTRAVVPLYPGQNEVSVATEGIPSGYRVVISLVETDSHAVEVSRQTLMDKAFQFGGVHNDEPGPFDYVSICSFSGDFVARAEL